jgi:hypothetical protein
MNIRVNQAYTLFEDLESRMTHFQEGDDEEDIPCQKPVSPIQGPIMRNCTKKQQQEVNTFLIELKSNINYIYYLNIVHVSC